MKKILSLSLLMILCVILTGCSNSKVEDNNQGKIEKSKQPKSSILDISDPEYVNEQGVKIHQPWGLYEYGKQSGKQEAENRGTMAGFSDNASYTGMSVYYWDGQIYSEDVGYVVHPGGVNFKINKASNGDMIIPFQVRLSNPNSKTFYGSVWRYFDTFNPEIAIYGAVSNDMKKLSENIGQGYIRYERAYATFNGYIVLPNYTSLDEYRAVSDGNIVLFAIALGETTTGNSDVFQAYGLSQKDSIPTLKKLSEGAYLSF